MKVILFGSLFNPLSATAAQYLNKRKFLKLIIVTKSRIGSHEGIIYDFSRACVGLYRIFHIFLRMTRIKRSGDYLSLLEYLIDNPDIPRLLYERNPTVFRKALDLRLKVLKIERVIAVSCIFPFKIPADLPGIEKLFNVHPGKLPMNKGPNPYFWALAKEMKMSAITFHVLTPEYDSGPVLLERVFPITYEISEYRLEKISLEYLKDALISFFEQIEACQLSAVPQGSGNRYPQPSARDRKKYKRCSIIRIEDFFSNIRNKPSNQRSLA